MDAKLHIDASQTRATQPCALDESQKLAIREELQKVLDSHAFQGSRRSKEFLAFVVQRALQGRHDDLKERTIGIELCGRSASYATGEDSVVRVKATEVRKRLTQYYAEHAQPSPVRIELHAGSYTPVFHWSSMDFVTPPNRQAGLGPRRWFLGALLAAGLVLAVFAVTFRHAIAPSPAVAHASAPLEEFWAPAMTSPQPVVICLASPTVYQLGPAFFASHRVRHEPEGTGLFEVKLKPNQYLAAQDIIKVPDQYVANGDALTAALLTAMFTRMGKTWQLRIDPALSFADLRDSPAVLIGAFNNRWTLQMSANLPVVFVDQDSKLSIREQKPGGRVWVSPMSASGQTPLDYALISRIPISKTGQSLIAVGGITQYGTQAAGEFITGETDLAQILAQAPKDWKNKVLQVVIQTHVIGSTAGPPQVIATYFK